MAKTRSNNFAPPLITKKTKKISTMKTPNLTNKNNFKSGKKGILKKAKVNRVLKNIKKRVNIKKVCQNPKLKNPKIKLRSASSEIC